MSKFSVNLILEQHSSVNNTTNLVYLKSTHPSMVISRTIIARVNPGFPIRGGANPRGGGGPTYDYTILPISPQTA